MIILDTNVLSETVKPTPSPAVMAWLSTQPVEELFTTAINQAEILFGAELLPKGRRRETLRSTIEAMFAVEFGGRILPFDDGAARVYAKIAAVRRSRGRPISQMDAQIAAIARSRNASIATRNAEDFRGCGIEVINPWTAGATESAEKGKQRR